MSKYDVAVLSNAPQQQRSRQLTLRILEAADQVLKRKGLAGFTVRAIATEAGVSLGGLYRRFADRDELVGAVHEHVLAQLQRQVARDLEDPSLRSVREVVRTFIQRIAQTFEEDAHLFVAIRSAADADVRYRRAVAAQESLYASLVGAAARFQTEIRKPDWRFALRIVLQMTVATLLRRAQFGPDFGADAQDWRALEAELIGAANAYLTSPPQED